MENINTTVSISDIDILIKIGYYASALKLINSCKFTKQTVQNILLSECKDLIDKIPIVDISSDHIIECIKENKISSIKLLTQRGVNIDNDAYLEFICKYDRIEILIIIKLVDRLCAIATDRYINLCLIEGSYKILNLILVKRNNIINDKIVTLAVKNSTINCLTVLHKHGGLLTGYHFIAAAEADNLDNFKWIMKCLGSKYFLPPTIGWVAGPKVLGWVCENGQVAPGMEKRIIEILGNTESCLSICINLYESKRLISYDSECMRLAINHNNLPLVKWIHALGVQITTEISSYALQTGRIKILDWFYQMSYPIENEQENKDAPQTNSYANKWYIEYINVMNNINSKPYVVSSLLDGNWRAHRKKMDPYEYYLSITNSATRKRSDTI